ncbi:MAG: oligosaccharide flippase family protein [Synechococcales cyanobacterium M58_A2018_015]|nr:oligosaccharide flippase family protein [Synechococcales cyanobacterium M58_A2018_015]
MEPPLTSNPISTLVRGASAALVTQTLSVGITYLAQVLFARWMGVAEYGIYEYVVTVSTMLGFWAGLGLPNVVLRFVPEYSVKQDWAHVRGVLLGSWWQTLVASLIISTLAAVVILNLAARWSLPYTTQLLLSMAGVPLIALIKLQQEMARAIRRITLAYAPLLVVYPLLLILGAFAWWGWRGNFTSTTAIGLSLLAMLLVLVAQLQVFQRNLSSEVHTARPAYAVKQWLAVALPLLLIDSSFLILNQTDTLMLAALLDTEAVGLYTAAFKTAGWVNFILIAVNAIAAPMFASLYAQGDRAALQHLVFTIARWMFYPALIVGVGLVVWAEPVLSLFGPEFGVAQAALAALVVGQFVNVGAGSVGYLLTMTGHHNQCAFVVGCSAGLNILLNLIGIPWLGILGAALATAISMAVWNIWLNRLVVKYLGVDPSIVAAVAAQLNRKLNNSK